MLGSRVSESKHRKQQPFASTSGGLLEVEAIAAGGGGSMASTPRVSGVNGALLGPLRRRTTVGIMRCSR